MQRLEPIAPEELGENRGLLNRWKVYGIVRRRDLDESVLENMRRRRSGISQREIEYLRIRKSRRWALLPGFPQLGHLWEAVFDFGPYKSTYNGKHDLDGGRQCDLCHTWCRFGHLLTHPDWPHGPVIVGRTCAILLSDVDPDWVEKKLEREFTLRLQKQQERLRLEAQRLQRQREEEDARLRKAMAAENEAQQIAAAMLRDYALRQQGHKVRLVPLIPGQQVLDAAADPAVAAIMPRTAAGDRVHPGRRCGEGFVPNEHGESNVPGGHHGHPVQRDGLPLRRWLEGCRQSAQHKPAGTLRPHLSTSNTRP